MPWPPEKIVALRGRYDETQEEFCERLGVKIGTLRNWEQGRGRPNGSAEMLMDRLEREAPEAIATGDHVPVPVTKTA